MVDVDHLGEHPFVVDAGASYGEFCHQWKRKVGLGRILALEPAKGCVQRFRERFPTVELREMALLGHKRARVPFTEFIGQDGKYHQWGNIYGHGIERVKRDKKCERIDHYEVPGVTVEELLQEFGEIDYLKLDIEGAEFGVFASLTNGSAVWQVSSEIHSRKHAREYRDWLEEAGYVVTIRGDEIHGKKERGETAERHCG